MSICMSHSQHISQKSMEWISFSPYLPLNVQWFFSLGVYRSYNINKLAEQAVEEVLKIGTFIVEVLMLAFDFFCVCVGSTKYYILLIFCFPGKSLTGLEIPLDREFIEKGELIKPPVFMVHLCMFVDLCLMWRWYLCVFSYWRIQWVSGVQPRW